MTRRKHEKPGPTAHHRESTLNVEIVHVPDPDAEERRCRGFDLILRMAAQAKLSVSSVRIQRQTKAKKEDGDAATPPPLAVPTPSYVLSSRIMPRSLLFLLALVVVLLVACGGKEEDTAPSQIPIATATPSPLTLTPLPPTLTPVPLTPPPLLPTLTPIPLTPTS